MKNFAIVFCIGALICQTAAELVVLGPQSLRDKFRDTNGRIGSIYANFG